MTKMLLQVLLLLHLCLLQYSLGFSPIKSRAVQHVLLSSPIVSNLNLKAINELSLSSTNNNRNNNNCNNYMSSTAMSGSKSSSSSSKSFDPVISDVATRLHRFNWISWWSQVILTVISSITLLFARSVLNALNGAVVATSSTMGGAAGTHSASPGGFLFAGSGVILSYLSIIWTWGGTRLSRRLRRDSNSSKGKGPYTRIKAATMIRRAIVIGTCLNLAGMLITLIGAEQIVGLLAAKVLTAQGISPFSQSFGLVAGAGVGLTGVQSVQPLDVLIVQANTNTLLSHFLSLLNCLILTRSVHLLDPPSVEDDER